MNMIINKTIIIHSALIQITCKLNFFSAIINSSRKIKLKLKNGAKHTVNCAKNKNRVKTKMRKKCKF